jgi:hypothetical protein
MDLDAILISAAASVLGLAYVTYGKKQGRIWFALSGVLLMVYPYMVESVIMSLAIGAALMAAPFVMARFFAA